MHLLYDFFMKEVPPANVASKPSEIPSYLSFRWPIAIWNMLFTDKGVYTAKAGRRRGTGIAARIWSKVWSIAAPATRRAALRSRRKRSTTAAAPSSGARSWMPGRRPICTAICAPASAAGRRRSFASFLKTGHNTQGGAFGSMTDVINNSTPYLSDDDVNAIAGYLKSLPANTQQAAYAYDDAATTELQSGKPTQTGAAIFLGNCSSCHGLDGKGQASIMPALAGNPAVLDSDPSSLINLVLNGAQPIVVKGTPDAYRMPQYRVQLTDDEIAQVLTFVRSAWGNGASAVTTDQVKKLRPATDPTSDRVIVLKMR